MIHVHYVNTAVKNGHFTEEIGSSLFIQFQRFLHSKNQLESDREKQCIKAMVTREFSKLPATHTTSTVAGDDNHGTIISPKKTS